MGSSGPLCADVAEDRALREVKWERGDLRSGGVGVARFVSSAATAPSDRDGFSLRRAEILQFKSANLRGEKLRLMCR